MKLVNYVLSSSTSALKAKDLCTSSTNMLGSEKSLRYTFVQGGKRITIRGAAFYIFDDAAGFSSTPSENMREPSFEVYSAIGA